MKPRVAAKCPSNKKSLIEAIIKVWNSDVPSWLLEKLQNSMRSRIEACISSKGYSTKY